MWGWAPGAAAPPPEGAGLPFLSHLPLLPPLASGLQPEAGSSDSCPRSSLREGTVPLLGPVELGETPGVQERN